LKKVAVGEGMRRLGKKKPTGGSGSPASSEDDGGALFSAGYSGNGLMPAGHGLMKKKKGRPSKKGKGIGEDILHGVEQYGPTAAMMLPLLL